MNNVGMVKPVTYGRMGNFLFQAAATMAYAWRNGMEFTLPDRTNDNKWNPIYLQHLVHPKFNSKLPCTLVKEKQFNFQVIPFKEEWRKGNIFLDGYWQSEKYFKDYRDQVLKVFGYKWELAGGSCSVHVRRGDYLTIKRGKQFKHPPVPKEWMERAMSMFPGFRFVFFSDDINWCKATFGHRSDCVFSEGQSEEQDLVLMSCCEHHICSASTFSWWGAWLNRNPNKVVIMPNHWLSPGWGGLDTSDIVPPEWRKLP